MKPSQPTLLVLVLSMALLVVWATQRGRADAPPDPGISSNEQTVDGGEPEISAPTTNEMYGMVRTLTLDPEKPEYRFKPANSAEHERILKHVEYLLRPRFTLEDLQALAWNDPDFMGEFLPIYTDVTLSKWCAVTS